MSASIDVAYVQAYARMVHHLGQQKESRLFNAVRYKPANANQVNFERLAAADMIAKASRFADTTPLDVAHTRRIATMATYSWTEALDQNDKAQVLINPVGEYVMSGSAAYGRRIDQSIITAATAVADDGGSGETFTNIIGAGVGQKLDLDMIRGARSLFRQNEIGNSSPDDFYLVIPPEGEEHLFQITEVVSRDYNRWTPFETGRLPSFLGFKIVVSNLLTNTTDTVYRCLAFHKSAIGLAMAQPKMTRIAEDPAHSFATVVYFETTLGAVRIEMPGVVGIDIDITA